MWITEYIQKLSATLKYSLSVSYRLVLIMSETLRVRVWLQDKATRPLGTYPMITFDTKTPKLILQL